MSDFISSIPAKFFALVTAIIFALNGGGPVIAEFDTEASTKLTQTEMIFGELPNDIQLRDFYDNAEEDFIIPGLKEGFIPQGIFYEQEKEIFLISGYYKGKAQPSRVIVVDGEGNFVKSVGCISRKGNKGYGHFGGIAVYKDNVYVATTGVTHVLSLNEILTANDDDYVLIQGELYTDVTCSYVNVCDGVLYIGEFTDKTRDDMKSATNVYKNGLEKYYSRCNAFILDENGKYGIKSDKIDEDNNLIPDFAFTTPFKVQGMCVMPDGRLVFTASATAIKNSHVYLYEDVTKGEADEIINVGGCDVPLYYCAKADLIDTYRVPTYLEEVTLYPDGSVYIITESAAAPYVNQSKNPTDNVFKWNIDGMK
ncbi:MAG: hypothetical protein IJW86_08305 [Clostridia bacterium]|nr:hypothetical protein [Clostridia bacterium]